MNRYLILNCDDFGQSPAANRAIMHLLEERRVSSATIMPPAPAFEEAAAWVRGRADPRVGLHLTLTSELPGHRWSSLTGHPSLHDETGGMHLTVADFEKLADPKAVRAEINAQFDQVKDAGLPITHVDNHMGSLYGIETGRSYLPYVFWQCGRRGLPFRIFRHIHPRDTFLNSIAGAKEALAKAVALADTLGVAMPDYLLTHPYHIVEGETYDSFKSSLIAKVEPGRHRFAHHVRRNAQVHQTHRERLCHEAGPAGSGDEHFSRARNRLDQPLRPLRRKLLCSPPQFLNDLPRVFRRCVHDAALTRPRRSTASFRLPSRACRPAR